MPARRKSFGRAEARVKFPETSFFRLFSRALTAGRDDGMMAKKWRK
jgi:hypothetical protein